MGMYNKCKSVERFERSYRLDAILYKNIIFISCVLHLLCSKSDGSFH